MALITFHLSLNHIFILLNASTTLGTLLTLSGNFYYYLITVLINWIVCFVLSYYDNKSIESKKQEKINKIETIKEGFIVKNEENEKKINDKASFKNRLIVIIIFIIYHFIPLFFNNILKKGIYICFKNISIIFMIVVYFVLLKERIYLHHFISICFMTIFMILTSDFKKQIIKNILPSIVFFCYTGFLKSYLKYLMLNKFITPYFCSFVSTFILAIKTYLTFIIDNKSINDAKFNFNLQLFIYLICNSLDCLFEHLVIYLFSPFHQVIAEIIGDFFQNFSINLFYFIQFIGRLFFILLFNEIIVLDCFGLGKNTKESIKKRGELEDRKILESLEISETNSKNYLNDSENGELN